MHFRKQFLSCYNIPGREVGAKNTKILEID